MTNKFFYTEISIEVKTYDIDAIGHVSNIVYIRWLEDARLAALGKYLPLDKLLGNNISPVLVKTEIEYKRPIKLFDDVKLSAYISKVKGIRMIIDFIINVNDETMAIAKQTGIFVNTNSGRPVKPPADFLKQWNEFNTQ